jgi:thymidylate synthase ThyX
MIQAVLDDPALPVFWGKNQAGMQAYEELTPEEIEKAKTEWLRARDLAVEQVRKLQEINLHKQISNRILEPWMHIEVVCTATDWKNFLALRDHPAAQPEIRQLAIKIKEAFAASRPKLLREGEWHLPFVDTVSLDQQGEHAKDPMLLQKISAARCARVSYLKHDGTSATVQEDLDLYQRLMGSVPRHASPTEHQAQCPRPLQTIPFSNLRGWIQYRKLHPEEAIHG